MENFFHHRADRIIHKWNHYFEIYERHFSRFRGKNPTILEIGVQNGGSLQMYRDYFGPGATIYGLDIDPRCRQLASEGFKILIGDQADRAFLQRIKRECPRFDIIIDDGGHRMDQQIVSFEELYGHMTERGVYLCEDLHTSYMSSYGGGLRKSGTFIEYAKNFIDKLHAWHTPKIPVDGFVRSTDSLHFYDSVLVIERGRRSKPASLYRGRRAIIS